MNWAKSLSRWTMRGIHAAVLGAALLGSASAAFAQNPAAAAAPAAPHYSKSRSFDLPVRMEQDFRLSIKEIRLYVKTPTGAWKLQEQGSPYQEKFSCRVPQDGEYWYSLATVDRSGRMTPADINAEPPSQRVVVDTTPPHIQVQAARTVGGELALRCSVIDANPDLATLRAVCRTDLGDIPLEASPTEPGLFFIKGTEMMRHPVIVTVKDRAKNEASERINLAELIGQAASAKVQTEIAQTVNRLDLKNLPPPTVPDPAPYREPPTPPPVQRTEVAPPPVAPVIPPVQPEHPVKAPARAVELPGKGGSYQLINTTQAAVDYRIDQVGPSGIGKVEIYMTPDNGQTWQRLLEDSAKHGPTDIKLPGDGVYGIRIVVTNGNGFGGQAPARGDAPNSIIEVDTTCPFVQLRSAELLPAAGQIELRWNASDKNLGPEPVTLHYRTRPDEPWKIIARNVKNDGAYRWAFPHDVGSQFFFKVEVGDMAGNVSHAVSHQPTTIDMTVPRATIVGVSGGGAVLPR